MRAKVEIEYFIFLRTRLNYLYLFDVARVLTLRFYLQAFTFYLVKFHYAYSEIIWNKSSSNE